MTDQETTRLEPVARGRDVGSVDPAFGLPSHLLADARARLATFVGFIGVVMAGALLVLIAPVEWEVDPSFLRAATVGQGLLVLGHGLFYLTIRSPRVEHARVLRLGLAYEVVLVLLIGVGNHWLNATQGVDYDDRVFAALLIALYPIIVPSPPWRTFWSSLVAAAMLPIGILVLHPFGMPGTATQYTTATVVGALSLAVAVFGSRVVHGLGAEVVKARRLGSYELETQLGRGGMGEVWRARHRLLARPAAVKLIRPEMLGASGPSANLMLRRFEREAQATAAMQSFHTIELYDFGISREGTFYYVMELLDGLDLDDLVRRFGPIPAERVVYLLRQVCDSLGEAHQHGLIHRDIKPANIYVCRHARSTDVVKVLDFGLVTSDPDASTDDLTLTADQVVRGTPGFMAPEQITGRQPVDARTDLYALGCVAYVLLTGRLVFEGGSAMEAMACHVREVPLPPSAHPGRRIPPGLDQAVMSCLEKQPDRRPSGADALAELLQASLEGQTWTDRDARTWWDEHLPGAHTSSTGGAGWS